MLNYPDNQSKNQDGFVAIIALGIFAIMMLYAISLQMTTIDTLNDIRSWNNEGDAEDLANSMMEHLERIMKNYEIGWNTGTVICGFGKFKDQTTVVEGGGGNQSFVKTLVYCTWLLLIPVRRKRTSKLR